jgi:hypothetical protein
VRLELIATTLNKPQIFNAFFTKALCCCGDTTGTKIVPEHDHFADAFSVTAA